MKDIVVLGVEVLMSKICLFETCTSAPLCLVVNTERRYLMYQSSLTSIHAKTMVCSQAVRIEHSAANAPALHTRMSQPS